DVLPEPVTRRRIRPGDRAVHHTSRVARWQPDRRHAARGHGGDGLLHPPDGERHGQPRADLPGPGATSLLAWSSSTSRQRRSRRPPASLRERAPVAFGLPPLTDRVIRLSRPAHAPPHAARAAGSRRPRPPVDARRITLLTDAARS